MKEVDVCPISHCDHFNCDLGQLEVDCPKCGKFNLTCDNWYEYNRGEKELTFKCDHCRESFTIEKDKYWNWYEKITENN